MDQKGFMQNFRHLSQDSSGERDFHKQVWGREGGPTAPTAPGNPHQRAEEHEAGFKQQSILLGTQTACMHVCVAGATVGAPLGRPPGGAPEHGVS